MADQVSRLSRWWIGLKAVFGFLLLVFGLIGLSVLWPLPWWMLAGLALAGMVLGAIPFLLKYLWRRRDPAYRAKRSFAGYALAGVLTVMALAAAPFFYMAFMVEDGPGTLPLATITNGKKTIVFQGMQHVGSEQFYKSVVFDLENALTNGYTLFYEGVQPVPNRPDLDDWFNKVLRGDSKGADLSSSYKMLADTCGLSFQLNYFGPITADMAVHPSRHVTADVTYLDMKNEYDRLVREDPKFADALQAKPKAEPSDSGSGMIDMFGRLASVTDDQKRLMGILCRGFIASTLNKPAQGREAAAERIILDFRNKALARFTADSTASKIYITYGANHFPGFVADLRAIDPGYELRSLRWVRAMFNPKDEAAPPGLWPKVKAGK